MSRGNTGTRARTMSMRRWDGRSRITTDWFSHHNDPELNFLDGDLFVFLDEHESSKRGTSFRLHIEYLATAGFQSLIDQCTTVATPTPWGAPAGSSGRANTTVRELFLPAPRDTDEDTIRRHYLVTRNFFAWLYDRPMAGETLGLSLVDVMRRANLYRPNDTESNKRDMLAYLDRRGYTDFRECVEHALAALYLAETFQMEALWVNAFAHCVGMNHSLHASIEFDHISVTTKAMITRTRLEMDIRLDRVAKSLTTFFDGDLSGSYLGLTQIAKDHMDRFRSFLHAYFIEVHGFWPPSRFSSSFALRRSLYRSMYVEFRALYQYLVDPDSTPFLRHNKSMEGGMCTLQNIRAFDTRHKLDTLPHPLPLLPRPPEASAPLGFTTRKRRMEREMRNEAMMKSFGDASNQDPELKKPRLVHRFIQFEEQTVLDDFDPVDPVEGRKIRWILIYAIFQILASVISAPTEVRDTEGVSYPLCCQRPKAMPQSKETKNTAVATLPVGRSTKMEDGKDKGTGCRVQEVRPDSDYVRSRQLSPSISLTTASSTGHTRSNSSTASSLSPTITSKPPRNLSLLRLFNRSRMSLGSTTPSSSPALQAKPKGVSFHEILVYGYGNGLNETINATSKAPGLPPPPPPKNHQPDQQSPARTSVSNRSFTKSNVASSLPTTKDNPPISPLTPSPLLIRPHKSTSPPQLSPTRPLSHRPESPTLPTLPSTPSTTGDLSCNSSSTRKTSDTLNTSDGGSEEEKEDQNEDQEATEHHLLGVNNADIPTANTPTPTPTPKPSEPTSNAKPISTPTAPSRNPSPPPPPPPPKSPIRATIPTADQQPQQPQKSNPSPIPASILSNIAGPDKYLRLPSGTAPRRTPTIPKSPFCSP